MSCNDLERYVKLKYIKQEQHNYNISLLYFCLLQYCLPHLRKTKGNIIMTASIGTHLGQSGASPYCATKVIYWVFPNGPGHPNECVVLFRTAHYVNCIFFKNKHEHGIIIKFKRYFMLELNYFNIKDNNTQIPITRVCDRSLQLKPNDKWRYALAQGGCVVDKNKF